MARVERAWDETPGLRGLVLDSQAGPAHVAPGQYVKITTGTGEGFYALANAPGEPAELLVKRGSSVADALAALEMGEEVSMSPAQGKGYPLAAHEGRDIWLFAAGSGIAPIRATVRAILAERSRYGDVRLYHGSRTAEEFAYAGEHARWRAGGIDIFCVVSAAGAAWTGSIGRVQDLLRTPPSPHSVAYVCGMKGMISQVSETLCGLGVAKDRIFLNY